MMVLFHLYVFGKLIGEAIWPWSFLHAVSRFGFSMHMYGTVQLPTSPIVALLKILFLLSLADFRTGFLAF